MTKSSGDGYSTRAGIFIKPHGVRAPHETAQMEAPEIMDLLHSLDPGGTWQAGHHFAQVGQALNEIATRIAKHGDYISQHWRGDGATASIKKLKEMHDYVAELAAQANQTGEAMKWLANDVMPHYKRLTAPHTIAGVSKEQANHAARSYLDSFSSHVVTANNHIPSHIVGMNPAKTTTKPGPAPQPVGPTGPGPTGPTGPGPTGPTGPIGGGNPPVGTPPQPVTNPGSPTSPVTTTGGQLQGLNTPAGPAPSAVAPAPSAAAHSGGAGFVPPMPGGGGSGIGDDPVPVPAGASSADGAADGAAADGAAAGEAAGGEAAGAEAAGGEGMNAMPMMGGPGAQSEQDRQREAWMREDKEIWGVPSDEGAPPLLG